MGARSSRSELVGGQRAAHVERPKIHHGVVSEELTNEVHCVQPSGPLLGVRRAIVTDNAIGGPFSVLVA